MLDPTPQTYANHVRRLPRPYLASALMLLVNIAGTAYLAVRHPSVHSIALVLVAVALFGSLWYARTNALVVQDRVIRLEERLRLARLLPDDLRGRIDELSVRQLVALRFAGDGEVAELVRQVLAGELADPKEIKRRVRDWRPDHQRV
jgi:hypothetical protein